MNFFQKKFQGFLRAAAITKKRNRNNDVPIQRNINVYI